MSNAKNKIGLITDEGADLPKEIVEKYQIDVIPFKIDFGEMKDIPGNIYQKIREAEKRGIKSFITTSQPSINDFLSVFKEKLKKFEKILCLTFSSKLSGTFNSAIQAKEFLDPKLKERVFVIDTLNGTAGHGLLVIQAAELIEKGLDLKEIVKQLEKLMNRNRLIGMLGDPKWLEASGRLTHLIAVWIRQMQKIGVRPLIGLKNGEVKAVGIKKGVRDISTALFKEFQIKTAKISNQKIKVAITHGDNLAEMEKLKKMMESLKNIEVVFVNFIGNVLGGHVGPGTLILAWQEPC